MKKIQISLLLLCLSFLVMNAQNCTLLVHADDSVKGKVRIGEGIGVENGYVWVDLGDEFSCLWATCNVGASKPEENGDYFAWGETTPKDEYTWETYKYASGVQHKLTKYCDSICYGYNGFTDELTQLELSDDAAYVNWGGRWRMPTIEEALELKNSCTWTSITQNGVEGVLATGPNGNSIFLPKYSICTNIGSACPGFRYWTSTLGNNSEEAISLSAQGPSVVCPSAVFNIRIYANQRRYGIRVRPVCTADSPQSLNGSENGHAWVNLGLSVMWSTMELGATSPEECGDYYAWGETTPKDEYSWGTYKYCVGSSNSISGVTKYSCINGYGYNGFADKLTQLELSDDAARVNWGGKWRTPTILELALLSERCTWTLTSRNGVNGYNVTGSNGNSIFLPAREGSYGYYWSSVWRSFGGRPDEPWMLYFSYQKPYGSYILLERYQGLPVRPVCSRPNETNPDPQDNPEPQNNFGTQDNPYTIADVLNMNIQDAEGSGTMAWIKGYIVGCVKSGATKLSDTNWEHSSFTGTSSLIVADDANETNLANCTVVQLKSSTELQQLLNLPGTPSNYKQELLIYGELCKYFGIAGMKKPTKAYLNGVEVKEEELTGLFVETLLTQESYNKFTIFNELGDSTWRWRVRTNSANQLIYDGAVMSGFNDATDATEANKDWFISPAIDLSGVSAATLQFKSARGPAGSMSCSTNGLKVLVSNDYEAGEDPTNYTWTQITPITHGTAAWTYVKSTITIPSTNLGENFHFAFYYECDNGVLSNTWEIKNVAIQGE